MSAKTAPPGYLTLDEAAQRVGAGRQVTIERARGIVARAVQSGQIEAIRWSGGNLVQLERVELLADLDFARSEIRLSGSSYVRLTGEGERLGMTTEQVWPSCYLSERDIEALIEQARPRPPARPTPEAERAPAPVATRPAGRPPVHDWPTVQRQAFRRVFQFGLPERSAILVTEIGAFLARNSVEPPEQRTIERHLAEKLWQELVDLDRLIKDLSAPCALSPTNETRLN